MKKKFKLGVVGAGFMSKAIIGGVITSGFLAPEDILVSDILETSLAPLKEKNVNVTLDNSEILGSCEYVLFAIKPQTFYSDFTTQQNAEDLKLISIMAGVNISKIKSIFNGAKVVRCMPNTPCSVGAGAVGIDATDFTAEDDQKFIKSLFSSVAEVVFVSEDKLNAVTAISGSSPAYFYTFVKHIVSAGEELGISSDDALKLVASTMIGSGKMILSSNKPLDELINTVCSKGGTTIEAVKYFENNGLKSVIEGAVRSCFNRANELETGKKPKVSIYTDGACSGNPGNGGYASILVYNGAEKIISGFEAETTNNRMELLAVIKGLEALKGKCEVNVYSDSQYVVDAFNEGWINSWTKNGFKTSNNKEVKNVDLWKRLIELVSMHEVTFIKVKGHADNEYNNRCDKLAVEEYNKINKI